MNLIHDRDLVIHKGIQLFCSQGYTNLGIDKICLETGMTKGAFYNAFKSKENYLLEVLTQYGLSMQNYLSQMLNDPANGKNAWQRLDSLYQHLLTVQPKQQYIGCLINNMMSELGMTNPIVAQTLELEFNKLIAIIEKNVVLAQKEGVLNSNLPAAAIAEMLHSSFFGALTRAKNCQDNQKSLQSMHLLMQSVPLLQTV